MSAIESPYAAHHASVEILPRQPYREISDLLAAAILRARAKGACDHEAAAATQHSVVCLGFSAYQRVNANPSYQEGVRQ